MKEEQVTITKYRNLCLENDANKLLNELKNEEIKVEQCYFKKRLVDGFILGAIRALVKSRIPKDLTASSTGKTDSVYVSDLSDRDEIGFYLQTIAYGHLLNEAGKNKEKRKDIHGILLDLSKCSTTAERYFKGGWQIPEDDSFYKICASDSPDSILLEDFNLSEWETLIEEELLEDEVN